MSRRIPAAIAYLLAGAAIVRAEPTFLEDQFPVNAYTTHNQGRPDVCAQSDGSFVVVWDDEAFYPNPGRDGSSSGVFGRRVDDGGVVGDDDFAVNGYTTGVQTFSQIACAAGGGFVATWWDSFSGEGGRIGSWARRFHASADPAGEDFNVVPTGRSQSVCTMPNGEFIVLSNTPTGRLQAQRFEADATPVGYPLYPGLGAGPQNGGKCCGSDEGFVIVWSAYGYESYGGAGSDVIAQRFDATGQPASASPFVVNSFTTAYQTNPEIACNETGAFAVAWESVGDVYGNGAQDGSASAIAVRRFNRAGNAVGPDMLANTITGGYQQSPDIAMREDGEFLVVWSTPLGSSVRGIGGRAFKSGGRPADPVEFAVDEGPSNGDYPNVAVNEDGEFLVAWQADESGNTDGILARRLTLPDGGTTTTSTTSTTTTGPAQACGDPVVDGGAAAGAGLVTASDALFILNAAVGITDCLDCVCDVNGSGGVTASDALLTLQAAVGQPVDLSCPAC